MSCVLILGVMALAALGCARDVEFLPEPPLPARTPIRIPVDFATIQEGLDHAQAGDTVLVAPGTYAGPGNRDLDFGGRDIVLIGEGGPSVCIINCGYPEERHKGIVLTKGETRAAVIQGLAIVGAAEGNTPGGGLVCNSSSPTVLGCTFRQNHTQDGAGVALINSSALLVGCDIRDNDVVGVGRGGGVLVHGGAPEIRRCRIENNYAAVEGGGLFLGGGDVVVDSTVVTGNGAGHVGGGLVIGGDCHITNSRVEFNESEGTAGALDILQGRVRIENTMVQGNMSRHGQSVSVISGTLDLLRVSIRDCGWGGGMGGGLYARKSTVDCIECVIVENSASFGGGIYCAQASQVSARNCTIAANWPDGGEVDRGTLRLDRCVVYGNCAGEGPQILVDPNSLLELQDSLVDTSRVDRRWARLLGDLETGDPRFCAPGGCSRRRGGDADDAERSPSVSASPYGDYHVAGDSPARRPDGTLWGALADSCDDATP